MMEAPLVIIREPTTGTLLVVSNASINRAARPDSSKPATVWVDGTITGFEMVKVLPNDVNIGRVTIASE